LRDLSIYVMPLWLLTFPQLMPHRFVMILAVGSIVVGGILAYSGPPVYVSGTPRLASITGGITQMHPSAQLIALQLVLIYEYYRAGMLSRLIAWPTMLFSVLLLIGYGGRNEMVFVGAYFATLGYFRFRSNSLVNWSPPILLVLLVIASVAALSFGHNVQEWGSGRIGVWQHRLGLIWNRDLLTFLFGGGLGADAIWNPQWWWWVDEPANAHNGYLHIVMETGLIGLVGALIFLVGLYMRLPGGSKSIVIALIVATFFSNSYFQTPLLAFNFFMLASVSMHCWNVRLEHGQDAP
jgi:O-antigen ligase